MPHADTAFIPPDIKTKTAFYEHVIEGLRSLVEGQDFWVSNLANASSLLYHSYLGCLIYGSREDGEPVVNWCGFYLHPPHDSSSSASQPLLLGPFNGRPACQIIIPKKGKGVCADAFVEERTLVVEDVDEYPGHIACDALSQSEIVIPLRNKEGKVIGVLDLDSTTKKTFDDEDRKGLERIVDILRL